MNLPRVSSYAEWFHPENLTPILEFFEGMILSDPQLVGLSESPIEVLENYSKLRVRFVSSSVGTCSVSGYYSPTPPTLNIHRSNSSERDNFTALHEFGHHLQQSTPDWAFSVLAHLDEYQRGQLEEEVADALAAKILIPPETILENFPDGQLRARSLVALYDSCAASRQACCISAANHTKESDKALVMLSDLEGVISFSMSSHDSVQQVPVGVSQPDVQRLISEAIRSDSYAQGSTQSGLVFTTANRRYDLRIEVALDRSGAWAFVVARPERRYGKPQWGVARQQCVSPACEYQFDVVGSDSRCKCGDYQCPECHACSCPSNAPVCEECFLELHAADIAANRSIHAHHDE